MAAPFRKTPNVSQYVANLNTIPEPASALSSGTGAELGWEEDDLARFTNTEFLDFEAGDLGGFLEGGFGGEGEGEGEREGSGGGNGVGNGNGHMGEGKKRQRVGRGGARKEGDTGAGFVDDHFPLNDISSFLPNDQHSTFHSPLQTNYPLPHQIYPPPSFTSPTTTTSYTHPPYPTHPLPTTTPAPSNADTSADLDSTASRLAAEEDKRRRNTAASARFRVKKKQREQALETTAKDLEAKVVGLEQRIGQLEAENEFLRDLVTGRDGGSKGELKRRWEGRSSVEGEGLEKGRGSVKRGVGTKD